MLRESSFGSQVCHSVASAVERCRAPGPAAIILDWQIDTRDSLNELAGLKAAFPASPVILTTAAPSTDLIVRAIKSGAFDFIGKPLDAARLYASVSKAVAHGRLLVRLLSLGEDADAELGLVGQGRAIREVIETIRMAAPTDASLLILGESGTGKELAARLAHRLSGRKGELVCVNMAALPRELVESTLFGHERGSFTGADRRKAGLCEQAADGTLFFDEIGEMPLDLQAKLLRFLEDRTIRRVGGTEEVRLDVRIVAATNRDLTEEVRDGRFREDLFYRLNTITVEMPRLAERGDDIALLATRFLTEFSERYRRGFQSISAGAMEVLQSHDWPGNVRELRQLIERSVVLHDAVELTPQMLPKQLTVSRPLVAQAVGPVQAKAVAPSPVTGDTIVPLEEMERLAIQAAMTKCNGSAREAAKLLGISLATLYRRLKP
jgi:two-component system response regulator HydG